MSKTLSSTLVEAINDEFEGHLLLLQRTENPEQEKASLDILTRHGAFDAKIFEAPATKHQAVSG